VGKKLKIGELSTDTGRDILKLISKLSPNVRKYAEAKEASLIKLVELSQTYETISLMPQTQGRIFKQMQRFLDWCVREGRARDQPLVNSQHKSKARGIPSWRSNRCASLNPSQSQG
jgi:site-specific recombinase XerD